MNKRKLLVFCLIGVLIGQYVVPLIYNSILTSTVSPDCKPDDYYNDPYNYHFFGSPRLTKCLQFKSAETWTYYQAYNASKDCSNSPLKILCMVTVAVKTQNASVCSERNLQEFDAGAGAFCYYQLALDQRNLSVCDEIDRKYSNLCEADCREHVTEMKREEKELPSNYNLLYLPQFNTQCSTLAKREVWTQIPKTSQQDILSIRS